MILPRPPALGLSRLWGTAWGWGLVLHPQPGSVGRWEERGGALSGGIAQLRPWVQHHRGPARIWVGSAAKHGKCMRRSPKKFNPALVPLLGHRERCWEVREEAALVPRLPDPQAGLGTALWWAGSCSGLSPSWRQGARMLHTVSTRCHPEHPLLPKASCKKKAKPQKHPL